MLLHNYLRPAATPDTSYSPLDIARAYNYPAALTGKGRTVGIIELGGGFVQADLDTYSAALGVPTVTVNVVLVAGGTNTPDGPNGADGEVMLDVEVVHAVAPAAAVNVYFCPNTDAGFLAGIHRAIADLSAGDAISISWGQAESEWDPAMLQSYDAAFAAAKAKGITVTCAAGDSGSRDGTSSPVTDFPASSPHVVGCGGTRLTIGSDGQRFAEVTWNDNPTSSATGGGASKVFPGRDVPDLAGNADPQTGWQVRIDGSAYVIGGTSAVAPLLAGIVVLLSSGVGPFDLMSTVTDHPDVCFDVTAGNNGDYRAGLGRDETTGFGVPDGGRLLTALTGTAPPVIPPPPAPDVSQADRDLAAAVPARWLTSRHVGDNAKVQAALLAWKQATGL